MIVRQPNPSEIPTLAHYNREAALETDNLTLDIDNSLQGVSAIIEDAKKGFFLVGEVENKIVSMLLITYEWSDWRNANWYLVQSVYTLPEYRRQKYFSRLLKHVEEIALADGKCCGLKLEVRSDNKNAQNVYKSLGFRNSEYMVMTKGQ